VCPEVECGLPIPREAMRLVGEAESPRLVTRETGIDHTDRMLQWSARRLKQIEKEKLCGFIFKIRSPSSGMRDVKVYKDGGVRNNGVGIWAREFMRHFPHIPVEDDGRLHDPGLRENFIERIFVFHRWQECMADGGSMRSLVEFHTQHKLLIMAHSTKVLGQLGKHVAQGKSMARSELLNQYAGILLEGLKLEATVKKNTNVLYHILGYFKQNLSADEKSEMVETISTYHRGLVPLVVPLTLLNHYVRKYHDAYLTKQYYLHPHPVELMLRNHV
jgi:uncharacterized protein YbgA (DUF1722 family)/uncharacterized protein YbbK (DUF523 family)